MEERGLVPFSPSHRNSAEIGRDFTVLTCFLSFFPSVLAAGACRVFLPCGTGAGRCSRHLYSKVALVALYTYTLWYVSIVEYAVPVEREPHGTTTSVST